MSNFELIINQFVREYKLKLISKDDETTFTLLGDRNGDKLFTPRPNEEDDDWPDFDSFQVKAYFKQHGLEVSACVHEKGYFSVQLVD